MPTITATGPDGSATGGPSTVEGDASGELVTVTVIAPTGSAREVLVTWVVTSTINPIAQASTTLEEEGGTYSYPTTLAPLVTHVKTTLEAA